jgi:stage II sporulation protein GA (sporulation sigma-E factor processing peptidase)
MEAALWKEKLPASWLERLSGGEPDKLLLEMNDADFEWRDRLRLVPYRGVNRGSAFMLAIKPDAVEIRIGNQTSRAVKVLIGLDGGNLSGDRSYQAIIHPDLVQEENSVKTETKPPVTPTSIGL